MTASQVGTLRCEARHDITGGEDGDGVSIFRGNHVWVDHCSLSNCEDWLSDAIMGSTVITLSNNYMTHHGKVMVLGHNET
ncbi:hypothetical protein F2Q68_00012622 [Brassica cretica]|uniref:Pectate lyase domain-containing protein n=1 Tax=Brassica cretica TaxID=69181 RepID=A0A8S9KX08_BRACR|nr:hypothetical protein F2Q68_00012622 [Brassica cretica]